MIYIKNITYLILITCCSRIYAQKTLPSPSFDMLLEDAKIELFTPIDTDYKSINISKDYNAFQHYDWAIRSRKEKLEIRYLIQPIDTTKAFYFPPNANFMRTLTHLASNSGEQVIAVHSVDEKDLKEVFHADWGKEVLFIPKENFATQTYCRMLMLHKEEVGDVFVFFLFNTPSEDLDNRYYALEFEADEEGIKN